VEEEGAQGLAFRRAAREGACGTVLEAYSRYTHLSALSQCDATGPLFLREWGGRPAPCTRWGCFGHSVKPPMPLHNLPMYMKSVHEWSRIRCLCPF
jgi:hypothetical protein